MSRNFFIFTKIASQIKKYFSCALEGDAIFVKIKTISTEVFKSEGRLYATHVKSPMYFTTQTDGQHIHVMNMSYRLYYLDRYDTKVRPTDRRTELFSPDSVENG